MLIQCQGQNGSRVQTTVFCVGGVMGSGLCIISESRVYLNSQYGEKKNKFLNDINIVYRHRFNLAIVTTYCTKLLTVYL